MSATLIACVQYDGTIEYTAKPILFSIRKNKTKRWYNVVHAKFVGRKMFSFQLISNLKLLIMLLESISTRLQSSYSIYNYRRRRSKILQKIHKISLHGRVHGG